MEEPQSESKKPLTLLMVQACLKSNLFMVFDIDLHFFNLIKWKTSINKLIRAEYERMHIIQISHGTIALQ